MIVSVLGYHEGYYQGGGYFTYDPDTITIDKDEDGYFNFSASNNRTWHRVNYDINSITVVDFGAIDDGRTDCIDAVRKMFAWSRVNSPSSGIKFPRGRFFISRFDISLQDSQFFNLTGPTVQFGHMAEKTLILDTESNQPTFIVNARYVEINGIKVEGGCARVD